MIKQTLEWKKDAFEPTRTINENNDTIKVGSVVEVTFIHEDNNKEVVDLIYTGISDIEDKIIFHLENDNMKIDLHQSKGTGEEFGWIERK